MPNCISIGTAISAQLTTESPHFTMGSHFPLKIAPSHGEIWTASATRFLGPTRVHSPNGISIGSAIFADWETDHNSRSVTGHIYIRSTAMRPKKWWRDTDHVSLEQQCQRQRVRKYTYSSKTTAQSGRNSRCVSPAPCMPMNMSLLWLLCAPQHMHTLQLTDRRPFNGLFSRTTWYGDGTVRRRCR